MWNASTITRSTLRMPRRTAESEAAGTRSYRLPQRRHLALCLDTTDRTSSVLRHRHSLYRAIKELDQ
jgi:hypothetical protein